MVFQRASPFPMSIRDNIAFAPRLLGWPSARINAAVEESPSVPRCSDEVKDRPTSGRRLVGGQQQRLAIARCIAVNRSHRLDGRAVLRARPVATLKIEDLMATLTVDFTIVIVTHNMQQAARVSDFTAFMLMNPRTLWGADRVRSATRRASPFAPAITEAGELFFKCESRHQCTNYPKRPVM